MHTCTYMYHLDQPGIAGWSRAACDRLPRAAQLGHRGAHEGEAGQADPGLFNPHRMGWDETPQKFAIELDPHRVTNHRVRHLHRVIVGKALVTLHDPPYRIAQETLL